MWSELSCFLYQKDYLCILLIRLYVHKQEQDKLITDSIFHFSGGKKELIQS